MTELETESRPDRLLTRTLHVTEAISTLQFNFIVLLLILYLIGNLQDFADASAMLILRLLGFFGFSAIVVNAYSILIMVVWSIRHHQFLWRQMTISFTRLLVGFGIALTGSAIQALIAPRWTS